MAKLPDPYAARPTGRSNRAIVSDRSGQIVGQAVTNLAQDIGQIGAERKQRADAFSYARARSTMLQADIEARRSLEDDEDWQTYGTRYAEAMQKAREDAAQLISNPEDRQAFELDAQLTAERGLSTVQSAASEREADWGRADLTQRMQDNREAALNAKDEQTRSAIVENTLELIGAAKERGYVDSEGAGELRRRWTNDYAEGFIVVQSPAARIDLLRNPKGTPAEFISTDRRSQLLEQAMDENRALVVRASSQQETDRIMGSFDDLGEALKEARSIEDAEIRDATVTRVRSRFGEIEAIDAANMDKLMADSSVVVEETGSTSSIHRRDWLKLNVQQRRALEIRAQQVSAGEEPVTDWGLYYDFVNQAVEEPGNFRKEHLMFYRHRLEDAEFKQLVSMQMALKGEDGSGMELLSGIRTNKQIVDNTLLEVGIQYGASASDAQNERANNFRRQVDERVVDFQRQTGREATTEDVQRIVDELIVKGEQPSFLFNRDKMIFEADPDKEFTVTDVDEIPALDREVMEEQLRAMGRDVNDASLLSLYNAGL